MIRDWFAHTKFLEPYWFLALIILLAIALAIKLWSIKKTETVRNLQKIGRIKTLRHFALYIMYGLFALAFIFFTIYLAQPVTQTHKKLVQGAGLQIMISLDVSGSMLARDFAPTRIDVAKQMIKTFVAKREGDMVGMVIFEGAAATVCAPTPNLQSFNYLVDNLDYNNNMPTGTNIYDGLALAAKRFSDDDNKVLILITDGKPEGTSSFDKASILKLLNEKNIKVFCIGIGKNGFIKIPYKKPNSSEVVERLEYFEKDEALLNELTQFTGGKYFNAEKEDVLLAAFSAIDQLEKKPLAIENYNLYIPQQAIFLKLGLVSTLLFLVLYFYLFPFRWRLYQ
jgi:Ca-activated chloride channel homolog